MSFFTLNYVSALFVMVFSIILALPMQLKAADFNVPAGDTAALLTAVTNAANNPGADNIILGGGTYTLAATLGLTHVTVQGNNSILQGGPDNVPCDGVGTEFGVLFTSNFGIGGGGPVFLNDLTITSGCASQGGGILNEGTLTLNNVTVTANGYKLCGGGIHNTVNGDLTVNNSEISGNTALVIFDDPPAFGAGICNFGTAQVTGTTIINNIAAGDGGGVFNDGTFTITNTLIDNNQAIDDSGGGIYNTGVLNIFGSTISNNTATDIGGGICSSFTANLTDTVVDNNTAQNMHGGGIANTGSFSITNTTVSNNDANTDGGGIYAQSGFLIRESTISNNTAVGNGGGMYLMFGNANGVNCTFSGNTAINGGGVYMSIDSLNVELNNCTVTLNSDGLFNVPFEGSFDIQNTIVANNIGTDCAGDIDSLGYNIDSDNTCNLIGAGDKPTTNPMLGPLVNNGGPTDTHGLMLGSPAIDMGDPAGCFDPTREAISVIDQRSFPRPEMAGGMCDIGAFEGLTNALFALDPAQAGIVNTLTSEGHTHDGTVAYIYSFNVTSPLTAARTLNREPDISLSPSGISTKLSPDQICQGLETTLVDPRILAIVQANGNGEAFVDFHIPRVAAGLTVFFQAVDINNCSASNVIQELIADVAPPTLLPLSPGTAGVQNQLNVSDAAPSGDVVIIWGFNQQVGFDGSSICPGLLVDILNFKTLFTINADFFGNASSNVFVPISAVGVTIFMQAVDVSSCMPSNINQEDF